MSLLAELLESDQQTPPVAKPANSANRKQGEAPATPKISNISNISKGGEADNETPAGSGHTLYARLLALADIEGLAAELVHRLAAADLADVADETDTALTAYLYALADTADREAGRVPPGHTGAIVCRHCGPVFVSLDVARVLPKVNGWPTAVGCPWCHIKERRFPRPPVRGVTCKYWQPDEINPPAGMGTCECGSYYPRELHRCEQFEPEGTP